MSKPHSYNGNPLLKAAGVQIEWEAGNISEYLKCKDDPLYFIERYVKIVTLDNGVQYMKLFDYQKDIVLSLWKNRKTVAVICRQAGKTTVVAAFVCWYILFNDHKTTAILANKAATAREILGRVQFAYELLPQWLQQGVVEWNKGSFLLENGSRVLASSTSSSAIRGFSVSMLLLDEFAFVPNNVADEFFASVYPTISSGKESKIAIISTPNGMNHFYKLVIEAESETNGFNLTKAIWSDVPGRDQKWADDQKAVLGEGKFAQEMCCEFQGASDTLISGTKLKSIPVVKPIAVSSSMRIYEEPKKGHSYVMTVDTSRGTGGDYSAFIVFDVTVLPYKIVCIYADNHISPMLYPGLIHNIAIKYNTANVLIETNDIGEAVANQLYYELEYEETMMTTDGIISSFGGRVPGLKTTKRTKSIGCATLKTLVENDQIEINDYDVLYELSNFVAKGSSYEADNGHDDLVMCMVIFSYLTTQSAMDDISSHSAKARILELRQRQAEDDMIPTGFFSDGLPVDELPMNF